MGDFVAELRGEFVKVEFVVKCDSEKFECGYYFNFGFVHSDFFWCFDAFVGDEHDERFAPVDLVSVIINCFKKTHTMKYVSSVSTGRL